MYFHQRTVCSARDGIGVVVESQARRLPDVRHPRVWPERGRGHHRATRLPSRFLPGLRRCCQQKRADLDGLELRSSSLPLLVVRRGMLRRLSWLRLGGREGLALVLLRSTILRIVRSLLLGLGTMEPSRWWLGGERRGRD